MGDRLRLMITGVAAAGAIGVTVAGQSIWSAITESERPAVQMPLAQLKDFDGITLRGPDTVIVTAGSGFSVRTEGDTDALKYIRLTVDNGVLKVERRERNGWWGSGGRPVTVRVTMPALSRVWITGSGDIAADKVESKEFAARLDGSGGLKVSDMASNSVRLTLNGSGHMDLGGTAGEFAAALTGSGGINAGALKARTADIAVNGSGEIVAHADSNAKLIVTGSGHAQVSGTNRCQINRSGSGEAECTS